MIQNIKLITNQDTHINIRPIAACCRILNPFLYFPSSPAAVTIWNHPQRRIINAISANIPKIQLIPVLIEVISLSPVNALDPGTSGLYVVFCVPNPWAWVVVPSQRLNKLIAPIIQATVYDKIFAGNFFIFWF